MNQMGLDFGTSTTLACRRVGDDPPEILRLGNLTTTMPSLARKVDGSYIAGEKAADLPPLSQLIQWVKNGITERARDLSELGLAAEGNVDEACAAIISEAVKRMGAATGVGPPVMANLSCPSSWDWPQRERLLAILAQGGIETRGSYMLIDEPVAAGAGWIEELRLQDELPDHLRVAVVDIGGGTLDVALLEVSKSGKETEFRVLASAGRPLGGNKVDRRIAAHIATRGGRDDLVPQIEGEEIGSEDAMRLLQEAEEAKRLLARVETLPVNVRNPIENMGPVDLTAAEVNELVAGYLRQIVSFSQGVIRQGLLVKEKKTSNVRAVDWDTFSLDGVLLVGGGSRILGLADAFRNVLPPAVKIWSETPYASSEEMVVRGLALSSNNFAMSLDRPHFSVRMQIGGESTPIYSAYDPLYDVREAVLNDSPRFERAISVPPRSKNFELVFNDVAGNRMSPRNGEKLVWELANTTTTLRVQMFPDGHVKIFPNDQAQLVDLRIPRWDPLQRDFDVKAIPQEGMQAVFKGPYDEHSTAL